MTTPISDEQLAQVEEIAFRDTATRVTVKASDLRGLIARLRAAEADAKRYRWLCASAWYVGPGPRGDTEAVSWHDRNETTDGVTEAIDKAIAMERTP
ncbi:hypothetical protein [Pseudomonas aeruginosa]|uniref:hypothetical protein n=1 Tax=Pseudomonas aeruginosa TaxID=287 RepID=UPI001C1185D0|nr:hypothetical protein [Pseudomonas aeruginosa]EKU2879559.1 hypothetical protein [Pseudomonas aeruginosa]ELH5365443.1 hypothetical protein [Pseudomonas aeruginosa]ELH5377219.1 hypothetical protein [Pseudomonas aeruginosa]MBN0957810.1 hypothetical protein [Pseudomonas aeruginosa]MBU5707170.1 hypothetical protein [Pseudomonas aeruginosa]